jgi:ketosteroid isomerase-like protein
MATLGTNEQVEANKQTVTKMLESLSSGNVAGFVGELSPGYVRHCQAMPPEMQEIRGAEMMGAWLAGNGATFPDYHEEIESLVGEGDFVAWRSRGRGTMTGAMGPFAATGKVMDIVIIGMHRFEQGKVVETWTSWDNIAALTQLGLMQAMSEPA